MSARPELLLDARKEPLRNAKGEAFSLQFLDDSGSMGRVVTPYSKNLEKLGFAVNYKVVDPTIFQKRVDAFDFEIISNRIRGSEAPGTELLERFGSWYLAERNPKWLRRNALIILGNIAPLTKTNDPSDSVERMLRKYLGDIDPLLRAHALWAAIRLGRQDLVSLVERDADGLVQDELNNQSLVPIRTVTL